MEYRYLGRTGLKVSELCLGTMQFGWTVDEESSFTILNTAFEAGINFLDTADIYSRWAEGNSGGISETIIGKWMKRYNIPRDQVVLATKVRGLMGEGPNDQGLSRYHIFNAIEDSLRRLNTSHIDLYQTHWYDENTLIEETLSALDDLVNQGKVRYIGASNYPAWRLMQSLWVSFKLKIVSFVSIQPHYNLLHRAEFERALMDVCSEYGLGVIPYSPLAGGFLTGKYGKGVPLPKSARADGIKQRYYKEPYWIVLDEIKKIAHAKNKSYSQIALGWLLSNPLITSPIIGPRTIEQLHDNLEAIGLRLSLEETSQLNEVSSWED